MVSPNYARGCWPFFSQCLNHRPATAVIDFSRAWGYNNNSNTMYDTGRGTNDEQANHCRGARRGRRGGHSGRRFIFWARRLIPAWSCLYPPPQIVRNSC